MNIPGLSDQSLKDLHALIAEVLEADDALPVDQKRWGVRRYPDWKRQAYELEAEMKKRDLRFTPIDWSQPST